MRPDPVITVDLETVAQDALARRILDSRPPDESWDATFERIDALALSPRTGRVFCAGVKFNHEPAVSIVAEGENAEGNVLRALWDQLRRVEQVVTFNGLSYDIMYLTIRSAILGVRHSRRVQPLLRYYSLNPHFDVRAVLCNFDRYGKGTKGEWAQAFGLPLQDGNGSDVGAWYRAGNFDAIAQHCRADCDETYAMYCRIGPYFGARVPRALSAASEAAA